MALMLSIMSACSRNDDVSQLSLTFACGNYDRMATLLTGNVTVEGIDLNYIAIDSPREIFDRMGSRQEFDVAEFSSSEIHPPLRARRPALCRASGVSVGHASSPAAKKSRSSRQVSSGASSER
jgi:hypothetical protein